MTSAPALVLASASPRRREILAQLGLRFEVCASAVDEPARAGEAPPDYAVGLAQLKALDVAGDEAGDRAGRLVLGADTVVVLDDDVLGKPRGADDARAMIARLCGRAHEVVTGVAVAGPGGWRDAFHVTTRVWFRDIDPAAQARYVDSGEGVDKAGAYAIQGLGAGLVSRIEGSYTNVVGLPAVEVLEALHRAGAGDWP